MNHSELNGRFTLLGQAVSTLSSHSARSAPYLLLAHVSRMPQTVPFHQHAHTLHICLLGAQAIVFVTNALADLIQHPCGAQYRRAAGFMVEFGAIFSYSTNAAKQGYKTRAAFFACQFRPQAPDMACGLVPSSLR